MSARILKTARPFWMALLALLASAVTAHADLKFPELGGQRVVDDAHILSDATRADLTGKLQGLENATTDQLVVVTVPDLQGDDIRDYGYKLGRTWGIGQNGGEKAPNGQTYKNNGLLLIVAPNEHKVSIEVGYGLEPVVTDGWSSGVIRNIIVPHFKSGDYDGGVEAGTDALIQQLSLDRGVAIQKAQAAEQQEQTGGRHGGIPIGIIFIIIIFFVFFGRGWLPWLLLGSFMGGGRGGGWGGGDGGGGGGFSGGGGSFGGGGASGGW